MKKLSMQKAKELAVKVCGTSKGLTKDADAPFDIYEMEIGLLHMTIRFPDWREENRIGVSVYTWSGPRISLLFDPETLEEDDEAEDRQRQQDKREQFEEWVGCYGPDLCKQKIDQTWEKTT